MIIQGVKAYCLRPLINTIFASHHKLNRKYTPTLIPLSRTFCDFQENNINSLISSEKVPQNLYVFVNLQWISVNKTYGSFGRKDAHRLIDTI